MKTPKSTNREGLTFKEWLNVAWPMQTPMPKGLGGMSGARAAWSAGEDPTEYHAELQYPSNHSPYAFGGCPCTRCN